MRYTAEQIQFLRDNINGTKYADIHRLFNEKFNLSLTEYQVTGTLRRYGLRNKRDVHFKKGQIPPNKGVKGYNAGNPTRFRKGHTPKNHRQVGAEKLDVDGYLRVKTAEPKTWRLKHHVIWESINGQIPEGYTVLFADGDKANFSIENLILVSRQELMIMNKRKLITPDRDLTRTGKIIADIYLSILKRK